MNRWAVLRRYRTLVAAGKADDFTCGNCDGPAFARADHSDEPYFECWACDIKYTPGAEFYKTLQKVIDIYEGQ